MRKKLAPRLRRRLGKRLVDSLLRHWQFLTLLFLAAPLAVVLTIWRTPTLVAMDLTVDRAVFTLGGTDSTPILNALSVQSIAIEKFASVQFSPAKVEVANPVQYIPAEDRYPESGWVSVVVTPPVIITGEDEALQPSVILDSAQGVNSAGMLDRIWARPGAEVTLEVSGAKTINLIVKVDHQVSSAALAFREPFRLIARYGRVSGISALPYRADSLTYRVQLPEHNTFVEMTSQPRSLVLTLTIPARKDLQPFSKGGVPVTALDFTRQNSRGDPETTLVKEGAITYPKYAAVEKVSFKPPDFVSLDRLEQFRIEELALDPEHPGIRLRLRGIAGHIRTGSPTFPTDRRLALLDALWHNEQLTKVFRVMREVFSAIGGR